MPLWLYPDTLRGRHQFLHVRQECLLIEWHSWHHGLHWWKCVREPYMLLEGNLRLPYGPVDYWNQCVESGLLENPKLQGTQGLLVTNESIQLCPAKIGLRYVCILGFDRAKHILHDCMTVWCEHILATVTDCQIFYRPRKCAKICNAFRTSQTTILGTSVVETSLPSHWQWVLSHCQEGQESPVTLGLG